MVRLLIKYFIDTVTGLVQISARQDERDITRGGISQTIT